MKKAITTKKNNQESEFVYLWKDYDEYFESYFTDLNARKISALLNERDLILSLSRASHRQMNSWDKYGLLNFKREGTEKRKYSFMDILWLNILFELRNFGYPIDKLRTLKKYLEKGRPKVRASMPILEFCILSVIKQKEKMLLLIFADGKALVIPYEEFKNYSNESRFQNHIYIEINELVQSMLPKIDLSPHVSLEQQVTDKEKQLLDFVRTGKYESIEITFKNNKIEKLEGVERLNASTRMQTILRKNQYQEIKLIQKGGKIVSIVTKKQLKLK